MTSLTAYSGDAAAMWTCTSWPRRERGDGKGKPTSAWAHYHILIGSMSVVWGYLPGTACQESVGELHENLA